VALLAASFTLFNLLLWNVDHFSQNARLFYLTFLLVAGQAFYPVWLFQGVEKMHYITKITVASRVFFTALIFLLIKGPEDLALVPLLNSGSWIAMGIASLYVVRVKLDYPFVRPSLQSIRACLKDSATFFLSRASVTLYTSANLVIIGLFTGNTMVGYYSAAEKIYVALQSLYSPVVQALYPYIAVEKNIALFKKLFLLICGVNSLGIFLLFFFGPLLFDFFFAKDFGLESIRVLNTLSIALLAVVPSILLGYPLLGALGFARYANLSVTWAAATHIVGLSILAATNNISIYSVASMVVVTQFVDLAYRTFWVIDKRLLNKIQKIN
jgi:PST family polysaccharide transporter